MISEFKFCDMGLISANFGAWCSALATLPSLERVTLDLEEPGTEDQLTLFGLEEPETEVNPEPLTELLRAPALRFVRFDNSSFINALCHAVANGLEDGSSITNISFESSCSFPDGGKAIIANALKRNASVTSVDFDGDETFFNTLAVVLLSKSTLQNLIVYAATLARGRWFSSIFISLGMNTTLKSLTAGISDKFGDELCTAIRNGLTKNSTLEELSLDDMVPSDDDGAISARNALSFLRTNSTLKSLTVSFIAQAEQESDFPAFRLDQQSYEQSYVSAFR
jgi:hypothetical protein